jgi:hypothetical protein
MQSVLKEFLCVEMKSPTLLIVLGWVFLWKIYENAQKKALIVELQFLEHQNSDWNSMTS